MPIERGKKHLNYLFLNVSPETPETPDWVRVGYSTEWEDSMNPNEQTYDYIQDSAPTVEVEGYSPKTSIPYTAYIGDPAYDFVFNIYQKQLYGTDSATQALRVYQQPQGPGFAAAKTNVTITIQSFNDASQILTFDVTQRGTPAHGSATIDKSVNEYGVPTFTPAAP